MSDPTRRRPFVRFSVATLLFLMLCLGGYLGGYRNGFDTGMRNADNATVFVQTYPVGDLIGAKAGSIPASADFDNLIDLIIQSVSPNAWLKSGKGDGEINPFPTNASLVIAQNQNNHAKFAALLEGLRKSEFKVATKPGAK